MDARIAIVEDGGSTSMELGGEHESVVLGRGRGASLDDRTVSQMHVSLELQRQQQAGTVVKMRVLGFNPVCVLRSSSSTRSPRDVEFVGRGQEAALRAGDRLSLSIVKPLFYRVQEILNVEGGSRNVESSTSQSKAGATKEHKSLAIDNVEVLGVAADLGSRSREIDPVSDLGFLVEGSEFDKYDRQRKPDSREWSWKSSTRTEEDEDGLENAASRRKKKEDDTEWHGEDEEEKQLLSNVRVLKETRSRAPIRPDVSRSIQPVSRNKRRDEDDDDDDDDDDEDDDDDDDPTLGGFIVDDIKEEEAEQDGMEEEDEFSDDDELEEDTETPWCKYGSSCFRKNPEHLLKFRHPQ